eukprot:SRR837773.9319.p2 GENE.SRR837773.9319~~SRR837773.9319.p2  ORF type:complete len:264 (+),score=91.60 SRR837773.9319:74-865(+)
MAAPAAVVLGASGAVGRELVAHLVARPGWGAVHVLGRRRLPELDALPKVQQHVADMDALESATAHVLESAGPAGTVAAAFCTMGVGQPSKATAEELRRVDLRYPSAFAASCRAAGVRHFSALTSAMADKDAKPTSFFGYFETIAGGGLYLSLKGQLEAEIQALGFESAAALRPGTLIGTPNTPGLIAWAQPKLDGLLPAKARTSNINTLAAAMVHAAERQLAAPPEARRPFQVFEADALHALYAEVPFPHGKLAGSAGASQDH